MIPLLSLQHVSKEYGSPEEMHVAGGVTRALHDISFDIRRGEFVCMVGPSGGGKSTLLRLIAGLIHPTAGHIYLDGEEITGPSPRVGIVFQNVNLMPWRTVLDNVALPLELAGQPRPARYSVALELIDLVALNGFEYHYPHQLSGGMQQRAAIARTLAHDPEILLLDEPFGALDALTRERLNRELLQIHQLKHPTIFMVTHAINEAVFLADRVLVLSRRPGVLRCDIPIPLPRPRGPELFTQPQYLALVSQVRAAIDETES
ncbi:MAG: ABC transporter ATP-binding protein [Caldilineae bacterium]|nr:MAG: ABC transporter ATP-binding protein [Caldilineae bacterium]